MPLPKSLPQAAPLSAANKEEVKVMANRYHLERKLGSGAFGCAFLVTDLKANGER